MIIIKFDVLETKVIDNYDNYPLGKRVNYVTLIQLLCKRIEKYHLANFSIAFSNSEKCYKCLDISYDFLSIVDNIVPFSQYLRVKTGNYELYLYEVDTKLRFSFDNNECLTFNAFKGDVIIVSEQLLDVVRTTKMVDNVIDNFKKLLMQYFPNACNLLENKFHFFIS